MGMASAHAPFLAGLLLGASLIIAIGAQNAFVLRQGLLQAHRFPVALFCALSDAVLIAAGVGGLGAAVGQHPRLLMVVACAGALVLAWYGIKALRRAFHPEVLTADAHADTGGMWQVIAACAAFTWLNPHVYLDTVLLIGSLAAPWPAPWPRALFGIGAATSSFIWFFGLAYGARLLARVSQAVGVARAGRAYRAGDVGHRRQASVLFSRSLINRKCGCATSVRAAYPD